MPQARRGRVVLRNLGWRDRDAGEGRLLIKHSPAIAVVNAAAFSAAACVPATRFRPRRVSSEMWSLCSISSRYLWRRARSAGSMTLPPIKRGL